MKSLFIFFALLMSVSCASTSYFVPHARQTNVSNELYINTDLGISIRQKYASKIYPRFKPQKNDLRLNKYLKLHRLKLRSEILFYARGLFDNGHFVEFYPSGLSRKGQYLKLEHRKFQRLNEVDGILTYEKEVNGYKYYFGERLEQIEKGTLRLVNFGRKKKHIIPFLWTSDDLSDFDRQVDSTSFARKQSFSEKELDQKEEKYEKRLKEHMQQRQMILKHFNKLSEDKRFDEIEYNFFRTELGFNYARLNTFLNRALEKGTTTRTSKSSRLLAQTLLSYLSMNENIYKLEEGKSLVLDSILLDSEIVPVGDLFNQIKKQDTRILMINEAHQWPQCRYQVSKLLKGLKGSGFNSIFVEGVSMRDAFIYDGEGLEQNAGIYAVEPTFANFLKKAQKLGFSIYGYDGEDQADNIIDITNKQQLLNTNSRVVVYGGHDMFRPLMYQLKNRLDARVLSIDQARLIGSEAVLVKNFSLKEKNTYLVKTDKKNGIDFYLFESNGSFFSNSPDYAYDLGEIKVNIERFFYPGVTFIEIYIMPISEGAIPIFTSSKNKKRKDLTIPNGEYIVWQLDNAGQLLNVEWINTASKEE